MVGEKLGSFRIENVLGVGAMGMVYRATNESTGKAAAVKVVKGEIAQHGKTYERFRREAEILQQFRHPNIVRFLALGRYNGTSYFAMEFVPGKTLEQVLVERGPIPWQETVELGLQICQALQYAHEHGVVHRDLKPSNLMISDSGTVKLTDFGIAKDLDATALTATGRTLGTAAYMAPEQIRGTPEVSHKTDLYAFGVVLYQILTGQTPYDGTSPVVLMHAHLNSPVPRPSSKLAEIPKALDDLVAQLMAKAPQDRPWDAVAAGETLKKIRDKVKRGETLAMVWPTDKVDASAATRTAPAQKITRRTRGGDSTSSILGAEGNEGGGWFRSRLPIALRVPSRATLEVFGLVLTLLAVGSGIAYVVWPPSAPYLYRQAEHLMASDQRHDWLEARDRYLDPLDTRFPNNPYKARTRTWRDQILLAEVEGRARMLQSEANTALNKPRDTHEEKFVAYYTLIASALKNFDEPTAAHEWSELARQFRPEDKEERKWYLLASKRAAETLASIEHRRALVTKLLEQAAREESRGRMQRAADIRAEVLQRYGRYTDVAEMLGLAQNPASTTRP